MKRPILYLMLGYPGAGKTTVSKFIHELTGAVHLWADQIRRERFGTPAYTHAENLALYDHLNELTGELLATGQSVVFDTNFNFYKDRERLRSLANEHGAETVVIWLTTNKETSKKRSVDDAHLHDNRILGAIPERAFVRMSKNLQPPKKEEKVIKLVGENLTKEDVKAALADALS